MPKGIKTLNSKELLSEFGISGKGDKDFYIALNKKIEDVTSGSNPFRCTDYLIGFVIQGSTHLYVDLQEVFLSKNSLIIFKPYCIIEGISSTKNFEVTGVSFKKDFITEYLADINMLENLQMLQQDDMPVVKISTREIAELNKLFEAIYYFFNSKDYLHRKKIIRDILEILLYGMDATYQQKEKTSVVRKISRKNELTNQFKKLLINNYKEQRSVNFYAEHLFVTAKYLSEAVKSVAGKTAGEMIDDMVILEAKVLLKSSDNTISQIADMLHFSDQFLFSKFFKKHTGYSPSQYRNLQ